jgi:integrase
MGVIVRQKNKGRGQPWWVFINHKGKRKSVKVGSKEAANKVAVEIETQLKLDKFNIESKRTIPSFGEYAESWINTTVEVTCKKSTTYDYRALLDNHVLPVFKDYEVTEITRGLIKDFLFSKLKDYAPNTVCHMKDVVSGVLNRALDDEVISGNPVLQLRMKGAFKRRANLAINALEADELNALLDTVERDFPEHYPMFLTLARTGMRLGEVIALQWGDIDFNGRFIEVRRSLVRGRLSTPKSGKIRRVDMSLQLTETIKAHYRNAKEKGLALGLGDAPEFVFTNRVGHLIDKDVWRRRVFVKVLKKSGLRKIRIHDLRHTYATLRIAKGDNIADVSNQLGHRSVKLTLDTYYH